MTDSLQQNVDEILSAGLIVEGQKNKYRLVEIIGAGGMGQVWRADVLAKSGAPVDPPQAVAVKFMLNDSQAGESRAARERFEREIKVLEALRGFRGIVKMDDWGHSSAGSIFMVMEFLKDPTLEKLIEDNMNGLPQMTAVQIVLEILIILEPIHRQKFIHRDLKPKNIVVSTDPLNVRILDFGLAKPFEEGSGNYKKVTQKTDGGKKLMGSVHYIAPEQFQRQAGQVIDERTDLYSVGIILYELLSGAPPFRGVHIEDILKQHRDKAADPLFHDVDGRRISSRLQNVLGKALSKNQDKRYLNAEEFKSDLYEVVHTLNRSQRPRKDLSKEYKLLRKIGSGTSGQVWEGERMADGSRVAMKLAHEHTESDWQEEMILNETERAFDNDNIVKLVDAGLFENRVCLVMELMDKITVEDLIQQYHETGFPEAMFYDIVIDVCRGLYHAHSKNVMHRDVKPANFLRSPEGRTKVGDFGLAKRFDKGGGSKATSMVGTQAYMAPEQFNLKERIDHRADIYSVGVVIYEMLSGRLPFSEPFQVQHLMSDPVPFEAKGKFGNPDELGRLIERCLQKDREKRPQTMKEVAQELARIRKLGPQTASHRPMEMRTQTSYMTTDTDGKTVTVTPAGQVIPHPIRSGLSPLKVAMIVLGTVLVLGGGMFLFRDAIFGRPEPQVLPEVLDFADLLRRERWDEFAEKFDQIPAEQTGDLSRGLRERLGFKADDVVRRVINEPTTQLDFSELNAPLALFERMGGDASAAAGLKRFQELSAAISSELRIDARPNLISWTTPGEKEIRELAGNLDKTFEISTFSRLATELATRYNSSALQANHAWLMSKFSDNSFNPGDAEFAAVKQIHDSAGDEAASRLRAVVRTWARPSLAQSTSLSEFAKTLQSRVMPSLGLAGTDFTRVLEILQSRRPFWEAGEKVDERSSLAVAAATLFDAEKDTLKQHFTKALGTTPGEWSAGVAAVSSAGFRPASFGNLLSSVLASALEKEVQSRLTSGKTTLSNEDLQVLAQAVESLGATQGADGAAVFSTDEINRLRALKSSAVAKYLPADQVRQAFDDAWAKLDNQWKTARLTDIEAALDAGDGLPDRAEYQRAQKTVLEQLAAERRWLTLSMLSSRHVPRAEEQKAKSELKKLFEAAEITETEIISGGRPLNLAWAASSGDLFRIKIRVSELRLLEGAGLRFAADPGKPEADFANEEIIIALMRTAMSAPQAGGSGEIQVDFALHIESDNGAGFSHKFAGVSLKRTADLKAPAVAELKWSLEKYLSGREIVLSGRADENLKSVTAVAGRETRPVDVKGGEFRVTLDAAAIAACVAAGAELRVRDEFENETTRAIAGGDARSEFAQKVADLLGSFHVLPAAGEISTSPSDAAARLLSALRSLQQLMKNIREDGFLVATAQTAAASEIRRSHLIALDVLDAFKANADRPGMERFVPDVNGLLADLAGTAGTRVEPLVIPAAEVAVDNTGNSQPNNPPRNDPPPVDPPKSEYPRRSGTQTVAGIEFVDVDVRSGDSSSRIWIAKTELTVGEAIDLGIWDDLVEEGRRLRGELARLSTMAQDRRKPALPIKNDSVVNKILESFRRKEGGALARTEDWGAVMEVDIPRVEEWRAAFAKQGKSPFSWGSEKPSSRFPLQSGHVLQLVDLKSVDSDAGGAFSYLSGNVAEVVRNNNRIQWMGGSIEDRQEDHKFGGNAAPSSSGNFVGIRLVLRPKTR